MARQSGINPANIIEFGSDQHAALLGLRKVTTSEKESLALQHEGYTLRDVLMYGRFATDRYLNAVLIDRVSRLKTKPQKVQSDDPLKPGYHPPMFDPMSENTDAPTKAEIKAAMAVIDRAKKYLNI